MMRKSHTIRELLNHLMNTFKHPLIDSKHNSSRHDNDSKRMVNTEISQFEKTYISFPEFIDSTTLYHQSTIYSK